jgi:hypothetical protein
MDWINLGQEWDKQWTCEDGSECSGSIKCKEFTD